VSNFKNRETQYSNNNRTDTQFKISSLNIKGRSSKEEFTEALKRVDISDLKYIPLSSKSQQKDSESFFTDYIFNVAIYNNNREDKRIISENVKEAHFLFFDLEHKEGALTKQLSFEDTLKILEEKELNFILSTSFSYTEEEPRLHLLIPLLFPIKDAETYKYNWNLFKEKYLKGYSLDESCKNINRWIFPSNKETFQLKFQFNKNDYLASELSEIEKVITRRVETEGISFTPNDKALALFNKQVKSLHKFTYERFDSNGVIKFKRDSKDRTANVFISTRLNSIEYNQYTLYDKKDPYNVLFSYNDYAQAIDAPSKRAPLQNIIQDTVRDWFNDYSCKYLITNEGLGKSTAILNLGHSQKFIFAVHTRERAEEVSNTLLQEGIDFIRILNNEEVILKATQNEILSKSYKSYQEARTEDLVTLKSFLKSNEVSEEDQSKISELYQQNISNILDTTKVRIVTTRKLQIEIQRAIREGVNHFSDHFIIFDEFILNEWSRIKVPTRREIEKGNFIEYKSIWTTSKKIKFSENKDSFLKLLEKSKKILILTTERGIIEPVLDNTDFKELNPSYNFLYQHDLKKFEAKLLTPNVHYLLVNSTRAELRDKLLKAVIKRFFAPDLIISNRVLQGEECSYSANFIEYNSSRIALKTHSAVKGRNSLENSSLIVLGTLADEIHTNLVYYSSELYFSKKNLEGKDLLNDIQNRILTTTINQSIGRNQGFRAKGAKTLVILPLLQNGKTKKNFRPLEGLNYISSSVVANRTEDILKVLEEIEEAEEDELLSA